MPTRVIDASIATAAVIPGQLDERVFRIFRTGSPVLMAPELIAYEIANSAHRQARRGVLTRDQAQRAVDAFWIFGIHLVNQPSWSRRAFALAQQQGLRAVYDAIYLFCAEDLGAEAWTRDRAFVVSLRESRPPFLRLFPDDLHLLD